MATRTHTQHLGVINRERNPGASVMASFTHAGGIDVSWRFTACADTIVALHTVSGDTAMIKSRADKAGCVMAGIAFGNRRNVTYAFSSCRHTIVARRANPHYLSMIHLNRRLPLRCAVATLAILRTRDVGRTLAARIDTVVAL